jgi:hypothetical protein
VTVVAVRTSEASNGQVAKRQQAEVAKSAKATLGMKYSAGNTFHFDTTDEEDNNDTFDLDEEPPEKTEEELQKLDKDKAKEAFKKVFKYWRNYKVNWHDLYAEKKLPKESDLIGDLIGIDIGNLYKKLEKDKKCGLLPLMASCSKGQLGALNAEGYAEHCNSVGKQVLSEGNTLLSNEGIEMLMVLRMNKGFMIHMRENYWATVQEILAPLLSQMLMTLRRHRTIL